MEKKLPKVFANVIKEDLGNNEKVFYDNRKTEIKEIKPDRFNINQKINKIFGSSRYVYKAEVDITLKDGKVSKKIIGRNKNSLITMDNELINVSDIIDIEYKKSSL